MGLATDIAVYQPLFYFKKQALEGGGGGGLDVVWSFKTVCEKLIIYLFREMDLHCSLLPPISCADARAISMASYDAMVQSKVCWMVRLPCRQLLSRYVTNSAHPLRFWSTREH